ncbi:MAG: nitrous oxide-stimulated promoter family protein [Pseudomonadota bacterium]
MKRDRLGRERYTIHIMIGIYCRRHHHPTERLCAECRELLDYAMQRIDKCPFEGDKPTCARCLIHCYQPKMRERVRKVMRYAGPRMMLYHPILAILHYIDEITKANKNKADLKGKSR